MTNDTKLEPQQIIALAGQSIPAALQLHRDLTAAKEAINLHASDRRNPPLNAGPLMVALGAAQTLIEQLEKHVRENTPPKPAAPTQN